MSEQQIDVKPKPNNDDEIDLLALVKTIWIGRKTIIFSLITGATLGLIIALLTPKEYTASTVIVPQLGDTQSKLGGVGGLAALVGINVEVNPASELSPMVYPQIISSIPFQLELMKVPVNFEDYPMPITIFDYYIRYRKPSVFGIIGKYTIGLPGVLISTIKGKTKELNFPGDSTANPISLTKDQVIVQKVLEKFVFLELNSKEGYITLTARMPEALAAAQLAQNAQIMLQRYITEFKINKAKTNLDFIQGRYDENKAEFEKVQVNLASVTDRNKNFTSGLPRIETDRIQAKYTIVFSVFQELAKQLEQAKIQVKKDTPVFAILKPVTVPSEKSKPNRPKIMLIWIFLGGFAGIGIVLGKEFIVPVKKRWTEV